MTSKSKTAIGLWCNKNLSLNLLDTRCRHPTLAAIVEADGNPVGDAAVGDGDAGAFVQQEGLGASGVGRFLHAHRRRNDDGSALGEVLLFLLIGEKVADEEKRKEKDGSEEADLPQPDACGEEVEQEQQQGESNGNDSKTRPTIDACQADERTIPREEEQFAFGRDFVNGFATGELEIEADVVVARLQLQGTLVGEDGLRDVVGAEMGVAEVVVEFGGGLHLDKTIVVGDGLLVMASLIGFVGSVFRRGSQRSEG